MATSKEWAQDVFVCDLCDKPTQQFCNSCQISLCEDCVKKHREKLNHLPHDIVSFLDRRIQLAFPECQKHSGRRCEAHCQQCHTPVCIMCVIGPHKGHDAEELSKTHERKIQKIKYDTQKLQVKVIPQYQEEYTKTGNTMSQAKSRFDDLRNESRKLRQLWHKEVDKIFDKIDSLNQSRRDRNLNCLQTHQNKIRNQIFEMTSIIKQNNKILKSKKWSDVRSYLSQLEDYEKITQRIGLKMPSLNTRIDQGNELSIELEAFKATLTQTSELIQIEAKVITSFSSCYESLYGVACVGETEAWICGNNHNITRVNIKGTVMDRVTTKCQNVPYDISVTEEGNLVFCGNDYVNITINMERSGDIETLITLPLVWQIYSLCCTKSGDILMHILQNIHGENTHKIVRYQGQKVTQEIDRDEHGNVIFKGGPLYIAENSNGDICVSDSFSKTVVVLNKAGKIRFSYDGAQCGKISFDPQSIVTDSMSQIITADYQNDCLHIINKNGHFLGVVVRCGLNKPCGLSIDRKGRLWVGLCHSGTIKVLEY